VDWTLNLKKWQNQQFKERTIRRMMQFAQVFPDFQIVSPLVSKLSWSHFLIVMPLKDELQREFYCRDNCRLKRSKSVTSYLSAIYPTANDNKRLLSTTNV